MAQRPPLVKVVANLTDGLGVGNFGQNIRQDIERNFFEETVGIARRCRLTAGERLHDFSRFGVEAQNRFHLGGAQFQARERCALFARLQPPEQGERGWRE